MSKKLEWDVTGERYFETGVDHAVLYPYDREKGYTPGVVWNGMKSLNESPSGGEETALHADNIKYASLFSAEQYGATIGAYTYPDEFAACDGSAEFAPGVRIGQQARKTFGLCYRTLVGNDTPTEDDDAYKLHLVYGCMAQPSEQSHETVNDSPDAMDFSWEIKTVPVKADGFKPTSTLVFDSRNVPEKAMAALEKVLYGSDEADASLPLPDEIKKIMADAVTEGA